MIIVGGHGLWLDELHSSGPEQPSSSQGQHSWTDVAGAGLAGFSILQAMKHKELLIQEAVQHLPSVQLLQRLSLDPKHKIQGSINAKCKPYGHVDAVTNYHELGNLSMRNLLSEVQWQF